MWSNVITGATALVGVFLGGWITLRNQDRQWRREHARQWRDIRLDSYNKFVVAFRQYVAFALEPTATISSVPHPRVPGEQMPFFDEKGRTFKEQLEAAALSVQLVCERPETIAAGDRVVKVVRQIAAARADTAPGDIATELFDELWAAQLAFLDCSRAELQLPPIPRLAARGAPAGGPSTS